jgi:2'-5' RNA ligase
LVPLGVAAEERTFTPHLTLAKAQPNIVPPAILRRQFCTLFSRYLSPVFLVNEVHLIQSHVNASGSTYETLKSVSLHRP